MSGLISSNVTLNAKFYQYRLQRTERQGARFVAQTMGERITSHFISLEPEYRLLLTNRLFPLRSCSYATDRVTVSISL
jgi:hypothetical protein